MPFFSSQKKDEILNVIAPLTFDLTYDLVHSPSCKLCPILNNYHDPDQRSRRKEVSPLCRVTENVKVHV